MSEDLRGDEPRLDRLHTSKNKDGYISFNVEAAMRGVDDALTFKLLRDFLRRLWRSRQ